MSQTLLTPQKGMPTAQIKAMFDLREESVDEVGERIREKPNRISDTISRTRVNERIREKLSAHLNIPYEKLWGEEPKAKRARRPEKTEDEEQRAA